MKKLKTPTVIIWGIAAAIAANFAYRADGYGTPLYFSIVSGITVLSVSVSGLERVHQLLAASRNTPAGGRR
ncbi:hypothetical protein [Streptomyces osmaniensis]|uniref:Uncharacterized protein n=1 Tax=Streptomyces osmaniensis TaxID=593134 RepID=A0ABP6YUK1_9ACTN